MTEQEFLARNRYKTTISLEKEGLASWTDIKPPSRINNPWIEILINHRTAWHDYKFELEKMFNKLNP